MLLGSNSQSPCRPELRKQRAQAEEILIRMLAVPVDDSMVYAERALGKKKEPGFWSRDSRPSVVSLGFFKCSLYYNHKELSRT